MQRIRSRSILDSLIRIRKYIRIKERKISAKYVKKTQKIFSNTFQVLVLIEDSDLFIHVTDPDPDQNGTLKLFVFRKGKGGNPAPVPYLVTSSSEEVHFRRDKSNDNPTYKEIIIENKVGNRIDP